MRNETRLNSSIARYLHDIDGYELLSATDEIELAQKTRRGDRQAMDKLVRSNLRFVISIAKKYQGQGMPLQDLISEGNLGLIKAAQRFDETKGFKFITYAVWWIRQSILQAMTDQSRLVRLPLSRLQAMTHLGRASQKLEKRLQHQPSVHDIAGEMEKTAAEINDLMTTTTRRLSLDAPFVDDEGKNLIDMLESDKAEGPDAQLMDESFQDEIDAALATLDRREGEIVRLYFGLQGNRPHSLAMIAERFHVSRERVRQIKDRAIKRLRQPAYLYSLRDFLG